MGSSRKGRDIDAALRKKGFICQSDGKHIRYFFRSADGSKSPIFTMISHGMMGTSIGAPLIADMARQLHLTKSQFLALIDCTLDEAGYREILTSQGLAM